MAEPIFNTEAEQRAHAEAEITRALQSSWTARGIEYRSLLAQKETEEREMRLLKNAYELRRARLDSIELQLARLLEKLRREG